MHASHRAPLSSPIRPSLAYHSCDPFCFTLPFLQIEPDHARCMPAQQVATWFQNKLVRWKSKAPSNSSVAALLDDYDTLLASYDQLKKDKLALLNQLEKLAEMLQDRSHVCAAARMPAPDVRSAVAGMSMKLSSSTTPGHPSYARPPTEVTEEEASSTWGSSFGPRRNCQRTTAEGPAAGRVAWAPAADVVPLPLKLAVRPQSRLAAPNGGSSSSSASEWSD